jgi:predicted permease
MQAMLNDIRYAARLLLKSPGFAAVAILTLALGIGANTAIFSLTDQVLLRRLPVDHPERLVILSSPGLNPGHTWSDSEDDSPMFSFPMYEELRDQNQVFANLLARFTTSVSVSGQGASELANAELVSGNYFQTLGVRPAVGRVFDSGDVTAQGADRLAVLSHGYWSRHFGADPRILNRQLVVNGVPLTIVGVARSGFTGIQVGQLPDIFIPITMKAEMTPNWNGLADHRDHWVAIIGRLKPGITAAQAEVAMAPTYHAILESEVTVSKISAKGRPAFLNRKLLLTSAEHGRPILQASTRMPLLILAAMVGLILLIACVNLASLLIARGESRQREIALRLTMGASRWRLIKQLLTESLLLSLIGGVAGVALAQWTLGALLSSIPEDVGAMGLEAKLDWHILGFAVLLSIVTGAIFGLAPALRATRANLQSTLKEQGANASSSKMNVRLRKWLLTSQVALTVVLLAGAGYFAISLLKLRGQDLGLRTDHVIEFTISPELNGYSPEKTIALTDRLRAAIAALPGVRSVSAAKIPVIANDEARSDLTAEGYVPQENEDTHANEDWVGPAYFATMGTPLLSGREFTANDTASSQKVAIISESVAKRYFRGRSPLGLHIDTGSTGGVPLKGLEIVGVVKDSKGGDPHEPSPPFTFMPYSQSLDLGRVTFYVWTNQEPTALSETLRKTVAGFDRNLPVFAMKTMVQQVDEVTFNDRLLMSFSVCLGLLAATLAAVGLYGVMAYVVVRRTREIGIRMAVGATGGDIGWLISREIIRVSAAGLALGLPLAYLVGRAVESQLFGVKANNPMVFVASAAILLAVALLAGWLPSRRAMRVDPMVALRYE